MAGKTISQKITLEGGDEIRKQLEALGVRRREVVQANPGCGAEKPVSIRRASSKPSRPSNAGFATTRLRSSPTRF